MNTNDGGKQDAREIIRELGWPGDIPVERLVASVYDRAMRSGMVQSAIILGFTFDRGELPRFVRREDRLMIAVEALSAQYDAIAARPSVGLSKRDRDRGAMRVPRPIGKCDAMAGMRKR